MNRPFDNLTKKPSKEVVHTPKTPNLRLPMKMKIVTLLSLFAFAASAVAAEPPYHLDVKIVVNAGETVDHPVYRSNFNALGERINLTPAQGPLVKRVTFGLRGEVRNAAGALVSASIRFTETPTFRTWKDGVAYQNGPLPFLNRPLDSYTGSTDAGRFTRPDIYGVDTTGAITTGDFVASTTAFNAAGFYIADHRLALGTDISPVTGVETVSPHTRISSSLGSGYAAGYTVRGHVDVPGTEEGDFDFVISPGYHIPSEPTLGDTATTWFIFKRLATVAVAPSLSLDEWVAQLKPGQTSLVGGRLAQSFTDPSGLVGQPYGYRILGFEGSSDLVTWWFMAGDVTVVTPANEITILAYPFADNPSRWFYRAIGGYVAP